jgi:hypothetical protein
MNEFLTRVKTEKLMKIQSQDIESLKQIFKQNSGEVKWEDGICLEWLGSCDGNSYGLFTWKGKQFHTHVVAYELYHGEIPKGYIVHHKCLNRTCVKPEHLELLSRSEHSKFHVKNPKLRRSFCYKKQKSYGPVLLSLLKK